MHGLPSSLITQAEAVLDKVKSGAMGDVATNKVEMHPQIKSLFELLEDIERELKLLADLMEKHEEDRRKLAEAEAKLQAAKEGDPQMQKAETQKLGEQCVRRAEKFAASGGQVQAKAQEVGTKITRCEDQLHHHGHHASKNQHELLTQRLAGVQKAVRHAHDRIREIPTTYTNQLPQMQGVLQPAAITQALQTATVEQPATPALQVSTERISTAGTMLEVRQHPDFESIARTFEGSGISGIKVEENTTQLSQENAKPKAKSFREKERERQEVNQQGKGGVLQH